MININDFSRQCFLGLHSESLFANVRVAIVGLGGGGSHLAQQLAHVGIGNFRLIDPDVLEASNLNRLVGATSKDVEDKTPKVEIARRTIRGIRPWAKVKMERKRWQEADHLIRDSQVIFGCVDGFQQRDYLETAARRYCIPYIDIGMDITGTGENNYAISGQMIVSLPGGPCMRCIGFLTPEILAKEENLYGEAGVNPQVVWTNGLLASLAVGAFVKLLTPWFQHKEPFTWLELDGNSQEVMPSRQPKHLKLPSNCPHHGGREGLGELNFDIRYLEWPT